ncbi:MAG: NAD(P)-dependent glycerol-3-phosphate dehydrogenase [Burkholderiaceae bacterium]|nr:NAD(P)-dependent glycerol-3-phosphate dehydrogenase [Burkholderiaceae bacterium]
MRIAVLGAGAWGTALAQHAALEHQVRLWARDPSQARSLEVERRNLRYLPGVELAPAIRVEHDLGSVLAWLVESEGTPALLVLAVPVSGLRPVVTALRGMSVALPPALWLCKGLERDSGLLPHQVVAQAFPQLRAGALSGPSFAQEVAAGLPVALVAASPAPEVARAAVAALHHGAARIYVSDDLAGVEVGGALKNVMAVAAGICDGLSLGHNARAALITRGLSEIARFGVASGARAETFTGLAGLGDLVLTCTGDLSRNRRVGLGLAAGQPLARVLAGLGHVAEGVACAAVVRERAAALGVELPIVEAVCDVLDGRVGAREAVATLLARDPKREH